jgi:DUF1680 family protein
VASQSLAREPLYQAAADASRRVTKEILLSFIPYYAFANREPTPMMVWVPGGN